MLVAKIYIGLAVAGAVLLASLGHAEEVKNQDPKIKSAMEVLKASAEKLGPPQDRWKG